MRKDDLALLVSRTDLSTRETEILRLACSGCTDKQIAAEIGISPATVKSYWIRIRQKIGGSNRTEAVARAIQLQFGSSNGKAVVSPNIISTPKGPWYRALLDRLDLCLIAIDSHGRIVFIEHALPRQDPLSLIGCKFEDLCVGDSKEDYRRAIGQTNLGKSAPVRLRLQMEDGKSVQIMGELVPTSDDSGYVGASLIIPTKRPAQATLR